MTIPAQFYDKDCAALSDELTNMEKH